MEGITKMQYPTKLRAADLTHAEYRVLMTLWTYSDAGMASAYPSKARIASDCGASVSTVKRALADLQEKGYVSLDSRGGWRDGKNMANAYHLELPPSEVGSPMTPPGGHSRTDCGATHEPLSGHVPDPLPDPSFAPSLRSEQSSLRSPSLSERRRERSNTQKHLLSLVRAIAAAKTDDDHETASQAFLDAFEDAGHEDIGYWDYGWSTRLDSLVRKHGIDYGSAAWLSTFANTSHAA